MRRFFAVLILVLFAVSCVVLTVGCQKKSPEDFLNPTLYDITVKISPELDRVYLTEAVTFYNDTGEPLNDLVFFLYPNSYREGVARPAYFSPLSRYGGIDIGSVKSGERELVCETDAGGTCLMVLLAEPLATEESVCVNLTATVTVPDCDARLGRSGNSLNLGNFYPILSVREGGKWRCDEFYNVGDPFYSESSSYNVKIVTAEGVTVAHSGEETARHTENGETHIETRLENGRDYAIVASPELKMAQATACGVEISYYYRGESCNSELKTALSAVEIFSDYIGEYPYKTLSLAETPFYYGGMEYPSLVFVSETEEDKSQIIVHEIIHQWFGCGVGSDSLNEAWVDEGLTSFLTDYYHVLKGDETKFEELMSVKEKQFNGFLTAKKLTSPDYSAKISEPVTNFNSNYEYTLVVYGKGSLMFQNVRELIGDKRFKKAVNGYFSTYCYQNASGEDLKAAFSEHGGADVNGIFDSWLADKVEAAAFRTI